MFKKITTLAMTLALTLFVSFDAITSSSGAPAGRTGSPASFGTCAAAGCHNGPSATSETVTITTDIPASGFAENTDYNITITGDDGGRNLSRIGFQASVESIAGHEGSLVAGGTDIKTVGAGNFVTHTLSGISVSGGSNSWTFTWNSGTAPDQTIVYVAANFANSNGAPSGDAILTEQLALTKDQAVSLNEVAVEEWSVYPNPASAYLNISGQTTGDMPVHIYDIKGMLVKSFQSEELGVPLYVGDLKPGNYLLTNQEGNSQHLRIVR